MKPILARLALIALVGLSPLAVAAPAEAAPKLEKRYGCTEKQVAKHGVNGYLFLVYNQGRFTVRHDSADSWLARHASKYGPIRIIAECAR
jgi:hypothetical protein